MENSKTTIVFVRNDLNTYIVKERMIYKVLVVEYWELRKKRI